MESVVGLRADLSVVLEALPVGVIRTDRQWTVLYVNAAAERMLGIVRDDVLQRPLESLPRSGVFERAGRWLRSEVNSTVDGERVVTLTDVTEQVLETSRRQEAEAALETNQEFLQAVLDNIEAGIVACDASGTLKLFNNATRAFHGIPEEPLPPEEWSSRYDLYQPDGVTPLRKEEVPLFRAFSGERVRGQEMVIAPSSGPRRNVVCSGRALIGRDGRKLGAVIAMHDVTHRKLSTLRLRHTLQQFRALFNHAPVAYHEIDCEGRIRRVNVAELRLLERTREEMIGRPVWEFVSAEERERSKAAVAEKLAGRRPLKTFEREYITPSGRKLLLEMHETLILDTSGVITGIRTAMLDITDRKQRELHAQALSREKAARELAETNSTEIRSILDRIGDAYIAFDAEWRYTYVNRRAAELARKPESELLGRCVWDVFPEAKETAFYTELHRCMQEQIPIDFDNYFPPLGKWFQNSVYPSPSGVGVFYRDVTDTVRTQYSLKQRTEELARKNTELETFVYVASHDLQEPLRMIGGYASLLTKRYATVLDNDGGEFLSYISHGVIRMQRLIKDLLALSRVGKEGVLHDDVKVAHVVDLVCGTLDLTLEDNRGTIVHRDLPVVKFNETRLLQVLQNLIGNALKYRREAPPEITVAGKRGRDCWVISVSDNGMGFDMEYAEHVFKPFKRLHRREDGGTGIGLAICKKIVETRGGRIWVESKVGEGTTFYFTVPDALPSAE